MRVWTLRGLGGRLVQLKHVATVARPLQSDARVARVFVFLADRVAVQADAVGVAVLAGAVVGERVVIF